MIHLIWSEVSSYSKSLAKINSSGKLLYFSTLATSLSAYSFINSLEKDPFDSNLLKDYGVNNQDVIDLLKRVF